MLTKIRVGIIFGGRSAEHEVSLRSAKSIFEAIDKEKYQPVLIGIDKTGKWLVNGQQQTLLNTENPKFFKLNKESSQNVTIVPQTDGGMVNLDSRQTENKIDIFFPVLHGPFGEDGTVQGLFKLANIPFVGAGVLGSAVGMDKEIMKRLLRDAGIPIAKFLTVREGNVPKYEEAVNIIGQPFFVKPANLGSSVGVTKVHNKTEYQNAIEEAFKYDRKILFEEFIKGREIECSVLGNDNLVASVPGEIIPNHEFYSYEAKYIDENGAILEIPANLSNNVVKEFQELAIKTFKTLACEGMGRVDFFLKNNGDILVNEINTIPGFTSISMYPKLWEASGITYTELISRLIELAIERFEKEQKLKTTVIEVTKTLPVPFYSQSWDLANWKNLGYKSYKDAKYWEESSCGILCLKMAMDYFLTQQGKPLSPSIADLIKEGVKLSAYTHEQGWSHAGLKRLSEKLGFSAELKANVTPQDLRNMIYNNRIPIVSIKWAFKNEKSLKEKLLFWKKYGGHLATVVGYKGNDEKPEGLYVHHTSIRPEYNWHYRYIPVEEFEVAFTGRCITIAKN